jgi:hypothetical protein
MIFLGHIAVSMALADLTKSDRKAAIAGNLLPDVTDKTGGWLLKLMPSGRWLAHGLPFFAAVCLAARLVLDERRWRGFVLGYAGHLVGDLYGGGKVPWLAPFETPRPPDSAEKRLRGMIMALPAEVVGAVVIGLLIARSGQSGKAAIGQGDEVL